MKNILSFLSREIFHLKAEWSALSLKFSKKKKKSVEESLCCPAGGEITAQMQSVLKCGTKQSNVMVSNTCCTSSCLDLNTGSAFYQSHQPLDKWFEFWNLRLLLCKRKVMMGFPWELRYMMRLKDLAWGLTCGTWFLLLLFDYPFWLCRVPQCVWVSFFKMQQQLIESTYPRKGYGKWTIRRKPALAGCFQWAKGHDDRRRRGILPHLVGKSTSLKQVQSQGPRRGWPRGWNFHYQGLAEKDRSHISSGTCNCLLISNNLKHVITILGHRNESCHRMEICFLP